MAMAGQLGVHKSGGSLTATGDGSRRQRFSRFARQLWRGTDRPDQLSACNRGSGSKKRSIRARRHSEKSDQVSVSVEFGLLNVAHDGTTGSVLTEAMANPS